MDQEATDRTRRPLRTVKMDDPPRTHEGAPDTAAMIAALRRRGRVHRFASPDAVPRGTGWEFLIPATGRTDRVTAVTHRGLDAVLGSPDAPAPGDRAPVGPWRLAGGYVVALPYDLGRRQGATAFLERIDVVVGVRGEGVWVSGPAPAVEWVVDDLARPAVVAPAPTPSSGAVTESLGRARFEAAVRAVLRRIAAGDAYVVNLTQQLTTTFAGDVHDLFDALRRRSPAPHGTVIELAPGVGIASVSPESFLQAEGRELSVRPIKGTRPRCSDRAADLAAAEELRTSPKERAENVMIVDLERNDLGRVCEVGSVEVPELYAVEPHPTVWQLVSTVRGRLRGDLGYASALEACFPCGSVTGAPKIAAMNVIEELEPVPRGWYCGAVGWVAPGAMSTSVTIRSAVLRSDGTAGYGTGSGIVADSDPGAEYEEARLKAAAFLAATGSGWRDRGDTSSREVGSQVP